MHKRSKLRTTKETEQQIEQEKRDSIAAAKEWWDWEDFQPQTQPEMPADPWAST